MMRISVSQVFIVRVLKLIVLIVLVSIPTFEWINLKAKFKNLEYV